MKVTILNGALSKGRLDDYTVELAKTLRVEGHSVNILTLRDMDIAGCLGCFGCWVKTPGRCINPDDSEIVCRGTIQSDFIVYASPVIMGFLSSPLKFALDRTIPLIMPYTRAYKGETHHVMRYSNSLSVGYLLEPTADTDEEDLDIIKSIAERNNYNYESELKFFDTVDTTVEEIANAINGNQRFAAR